MGESTGMSSIITNIGLWVTGAATWVGSAIGVFTTSGNELLLVPFYIGLVGLNCLDIPCEQYCSLV